MSFWQKNKLKILLLIIVPTITGLLLGVEMNNNVIDKVPTVIVDQDRSGLSERLTDYISQHDRFAVLAVTDDPAYAEQMIFEIRRCWRFTSLPSFTPTCEVGKRRRLQSATMPLACICWPFANRH